ncbi:MAG TPA: metalloregulator ArsR/SmtB family transcription factor, partial [Tepidisphaeraceae bacterium]
QATAVSDVAARSGLSLSLVSHHLRLLRMGGLVAADRRGRQVFYAVADGHVAHMLSDMLAHVTQCDVGAPHGHAVKPEEKPAGEAGRDTPIASLDR